MTYRLKFLFIFFLLVVSFSASLFIILESGAFFQQLYHGSGSGLGMGYWAASLNEIFMAVMAAVWLKKSGKNNKNKPHPINYFFKLLLGLLFFTTVGGASLNLVLPLIQNIQLDNNNKKVISIIESQVQDNRDSINTFVHQNQRSNSALAVKRQAETKEELKTYLKSTESRLSMWIEIILIISLRFSVQLANLSCVWLAGWVFRLPTTHSRSTTETTQPQKKSRQASATTGNRHFIEPQGIVNPVSRSLKRLNPTIKEKTPTNQKKNTKATGNRSLNNHTAPNISLARSRQQQKERQKPLSKLHSSIATQKNHIGRAETIGKKTVNAETDAFIKLRKKITQLLNARNEGITVADICRAAQIDKRLLQDVLNRKSQVSVENVSLAEEIIEKIEALYQYEYASSF